MGRKPTVGHVEADATKAIEALDKRIAELERQLAEDRKLRRKVVTLRNKFLRLTRGGRP